jgi:hypothetical protein
MEMQLYAVPVMDETHKRKSVRAVDRRERMMKILAKVMMGAGIVAVLLGGGGMDSQSLVAPIMMIILGVGLIYTGNKIDEEWI